MALVLAGGRVAFGVMSLLAPALLGRIITRRDGSRGGTTLFIRMVGARDVGVGLGLLVSLERGAPARRWLEASAPDRRHRCSANLLARDHIRSTAFPGVVGLAASGALLSGWLARELDPVPPPQSEPGG